MLQAIADESGFPVITGLAMTPTLTCATPGYDIDSQLFLAFPDGMFPNAMRAPPAGTQRQLCPDCWGHFVAFLL
jgi:hypothetical protein